MIPPDYLNQIVTGDARTLAERIPDASVDLIFTDPVYSERPLYDWLGSVAQRILKPAGAVLCWSNGKWHRENENWLEAAGLHYQWDFAISLTSRMLPMNGHVACGAMRVSWFGESRRAMTGYFKDGYIDAGGNAGAHPVLRHSHGMNAGRWGKGVTASVGFVNAFTQKNGIVFDPFCGMGTFAAIAQMLGRNYIAFEIDPDTAERARSRVANTQAMHPIFLEEQTTMQVMA